MKLTDFEVYERMLNDPRWEAEFKRRKLQHKRRKHWDDVPRDVAGINIPDDKVIEDVDTGGSDIQD